SSSNVSEISMAFMCLLAVTVTVKSPSLLFSSTNTVSNRFLVSSIFFWVSLSLPIIFIISPNIVLCFLLTTKLFKFYIFDHFKNQNKSFSLETEIKPPIAIKKPKTLNSHNDTRIDNYYWLNDRENPEVIDYLNAENAYTKQAMQHTESFQQLLFEEMKGRIKEDDTSVPYKLNGYWYITRYETGKDYPIYTRKKESLDAPEEVLFDCNQMAEGLTYFNLGSIAVSQDNTLAAFSVDVLGRRQYTIKVKNLLTGEIISDEIVNTTGSVSWANDNKTLFYAMKDEVTLRSHKIFKHKLGKSNGGDILVFHEKDETYNTFVYKSKSRKYIIIGSSSTLTSEYRFLDADTPDAAFEVFNKRQRGLDYSIAHYNNSFYIISNGDGATNFKVLKTSIDATNKKHWEEVIPHRDHVLVEDIEIFKDYLVVNERENGLNKLRIISWNGQED